MMSTLLCLQYLLYFTTSVNVYDSYSFKESTGIDITRQTNTFISSLKLPIHFANAAVGIYQNELHIAGGFEYFGTLQSGNHHRFNLNTYHILLNETNLLTVSDEFNTPSPSYRPTTSPTPNTSFTTPPSPSPIDNPIHTTSFNTNDWTVISNNIPIFDQYDNETAVSDGYACLSQLYTAIDNKLYIVASWYNYSEEERFGGDESTQYIYKYLVIFDMETKTYVNMDTYSNVLPGGVDVGSGYGVLFDIFQCLTHNTTHLFVVGLEQFFNKSVVLIYDIDRDKWSRGQDPPFTEFGASCFYVPHTHSIYMIEGMEFVNNSYDFQPYYINQAQRYDVLNDEWFVMSETVKEYNSFAGFNTLFEFNYYDKNLGENTFYDIVGIAWSRVMLNESSNFPVIQDRNITEFIIYDQDNDIKTGFNESYGMVPFNNVSIDIGYGDILETQQSRLQALMNTMESPVVKYGNQYILVLGGLKKNQKEFLTMEDGQVAYNYIMIMNVTYSYSMPIPSTTSFYSTEPPEPVNVYDSYSFEESTGINITRYTNTFISSLKLPIHFASAAVGIYQNELYIVGGWNQMGLLQGWETGPWNLNSYYILLNETDLLTVSDEFGTPSPSYQPTPLPTPNANFTAQPTVSPIDTPIHTTSFNESDWTIIANNMPVNQYGIKSAVSDGYACLGQLYTTIGNKLYIVASWYNYSDDQTFGGTGSNEHIYKYLIIFDMETKSYVDMNTYAHVLFGGVWSNSFAFILDLYQCMTHNTTHLFVIGLDTYLNNSVVLIYDISTKSWSRGKDSPYLIFAASCSYVSDTNSIYMIEGARAINNSLETGYFESMNHVQRYDTLNDEWFILPGNVNSFNSVAGFNTLFEFKYYDKNRRQNTFYDIVGTSWGRVENADKDITDELFPNRNISEFIIYDQDNNITNGFNMHYDFVPFNNVSIDIGYGDILETQQSRLQALMNIMESPVVKYDNQYMLVLGGLQKNQQELLVMEDGQVTLNYIMIMNVTYSYSMSIPNTTPEPTETDQNETINVYDSYSFEESIGINITRYSNTFISSLKLPIHFASAAVGIYQNELHILGGWEYYGIFQDQEGPWNLNSYHIQLNETNLLTVLDGFNTPSPSFQPTPSPNTQDTAAPSIADILHTTSFNDSEWTIISNNMPLNLYGKKSAVSDGYACLSQLYTTIDNKMYIIASWYNYSDETRFDGNGWKEHIYKYLIIFDMATKSYIPMNTYSHVVLGAVWVNGFLSELLDIFQCVTHNNTHLFVVGADSFFNKSVVVIYDIDEDQWSQGQNTPYTVWAASCFYVTATNSVYLIEGVQFGNDSMEETLDYHSQIVQRYDTLSDEWFVLPQSININSIAGSSTLFEFSYFDENLKENTFYDVFGISWLRYSEGIELNPDRNITEFIIYDQDNNIQTGFNDEYDIVPFNNASIDIGYGDTLEIQQSRLQSLMYTMDSSIVKYDDQYILVIGGMQKGQQELGSSQNGQSALNYIMIINITFSYSNLTNNLYSTENIYSTETTETTENTELNEGKEKDTKTLDTTVLYMIIIGSVIILIVIIIAVTYCYKWKLNKVPEQHEQNQVQLTKVISISGHGISGDGAMQTNQTLASQEQDGPIPGTSVVPEDDEHNDNNDDGDDDDAKSPEVAAVNTVTGNEGDQLLKEEKEKENDGNDTDEELYDKAPNEEQIHITAGGGQYNQIITPRSDVESPVATYNDINLDIPNIDDDNLPIPSLPQEQMETNYIDLDMEGGFVE